MKKVHSVEAQMPKTQSGKDHQYHSFTAKKKKIPVKEVKPNPISNIEAFMKYTTQVKNK